LVEGAFVGFAREEGEVFGAGGVLEFFDVGVVDAETFGDEVSVWFICKVRERGYEPN